MAITSTAENYIIDSLDAGLRALTFVSERESVTVTELADHLGVARSRAHRTLRTLEQDGFVTPSASGRSFRAGRRLLMLSAPDHLDPATKLRFRPAIAQARELTGEAVHTAVLLGAHVLVTDGRRSSQQLDIGLRVGMLMPAHAMAGGKLLLSLLDENQVLAMLPAGDLPALGPNSIRSRDALIDELHRTRSLGYALALQESERGVDSVAVLLGGTTWRDRIALVVSAPSSRGGRRRMTAMVEAMREHGLGT